MSKIVLLSTGLTGRSHELKVDKTTVGRMEDNTFQLAEPSVSSHHAEILLRGSDVVVKDLDSTNGTFINGEKISESVLKPGQILRLGQIEMRLETDAPAPAPTAPATVAAKKSTDQTIIVPRGVSLTDLEQGARATGGFDTTSKAFSKKSNQTNRLFLIVGIIVGVVIIGVLIYVFSTIKK